MFLQDLPKHSENAQLALDLYLQASKLAKENVPGHYPLTMQVGLNLSLLYYDVFHDVEKAMWMAKDTFDDAICGYDWRREEDEYEATQIALQLRGLLTDWSNQLPD